MRNFPQPPAMDIFVNGRGLTRAIYISNMFINEEQFEPGDQGPLKKVFFKSSFQACPQCLEKQIEKKNHTQGCRMNGDGYGSTLFICVSCQWRTSFLYDDASDVYYYETQYWHDADPVLDPPVVLDPDIAPESPPQVLDDVMIEK